jgi:hypothetical protein
MTGGQRSFPSALAGLLGAAAVLAGGYLAFAHACLVLRVAFAREQMEIFEQMQQQVRKARDPAEAVNYLEYAAGYYPSGTKQVPGSSLDAMVEQARHSAIREIIADLRTRTGQDLGDDPQAWVKRFRKPD